MWIKFPISNCRHGLDSLYIRSYTKIMAGEMRLPEALKMLKAKGYFLHRTSGSHHVFKKPGVGMFVMPVHHGKVKPVYVR